MTVSEKLRYLPKYLRAEYVAWGDAVAQRAPAGAGQWIRSRWYRRRLAEMGDGVCFLWGIHVNGPDGLRVGDRTRIAQDVQMNARGGITIGADVLVGPRSMIWSSNHAIDRLDVAIMHQGYTRAAVSIGDGAWLGANCVILPGVHVGDGAVVAAGAVVTRDVPEYAIVGGVPARIIASRIDADAEG